MATSTSEFASAFRKALAAGDEDACREVLRQHVAKTGIRSESAATLITDAMQGIGEAWNCQRLDAYQERRGCEICLRLIGELRAELPAAAAGSPSAIGGSISEDPYQLPTALVELALRDLGWNATNLGNNLPLQSYYQAVIDMQPKLVWLSISVVSNLAAFAAEQNQFAEQLGEDVSLVIGGRGLTENVISRLKYTAHCSNLPQLVSVANLITRT